MARYCIVPGCNTRLRTGKKYCWKHRGYKDPKEIAWSQKDFKPTNNSKGLGFFAILFGIFAIYSIVHKETDVFFFWGIISLICYISMKVSKKRFKQLSKEYAENPEAYNKKKRYDWRYKLSKRLDKPLFSEGKSTKLGRPMKVSAKSGIEGLYGTLR